MTASLRFAQSLTVAALLAVSYGGASAAPGAPTAAPATSVPAAAETAAPVSSAVDTARRLVAQGKLDVAVRELAVYVAGEPRDLDAARYLGDLYYRQADLPNAERVYVEVLRIEPRDRETHNRLGGIYAAEDRVSDAIDQFTQSLPSMSNAYGYLIELHRKRGDLDAFLADTKSRADNDPLDFVAQYNTGMFYDARHRYREAAMYLDRARMLQPRNCDTLSALGSVYIDLHEPKESLDALDRCLNHDAVNYSALVNRGDLYIDTAQYDKAHADLDAAHLIRPDGPEALVNLGYLKDVEHDWHAAVSYYLRAISIDPLMREGYTNLGCDYEQHQLYALAEAAFLKGLSIAPSDGRLHYLLAMTYADQGKRTLALAEYQQAANSDETEVARAATRELAILQKG